MTIETYDYVMLAVLLAATAYGAWKGMAWQVASVGAIFASYIVAYRYHATVAQWIPGAGPWRVWAAMLLLYVVTSLGIWILFRLASNLIDRVRLKELDRQMGALVGLAKGALLCVIITLFAVTLLGENQRRAIVNSRSGYYIAVLLDKSRAVLPGEIHEVLEPYLEAAEKRLGAGADAAEQGGVSGAPAGRSSGGLPVSFP